MCEKYFWTKIIEWYQKNKREFPWRNTSNPYFILIAEFLLQQTTANQVQPVYIEIINEHETIESLSKTDIDTLKDLINPLGLLFRAERMISSAGIIISEYNSEVPSQKSKLEKLPGVGDYIADAVLCYAFNKETVPIDTNVIRLFCRFFGLKSRLKRKRDDKELRNKINQLYKSNEHIFNN